MLLRLDCRIVTGHGPFLHKTAPGHSGCLQLQTNIQVDIIHEEGVMGKL